MPWDLILPLHRAPSTKYEPQHVKVSFFATDTPKGLLQKLEKGTGDKIKNKTKITKRNKIKNPHKQQYEVFLIQMSLLYIQEPKETLARNYVRNINHTGYGYLPTLMFKTPIISTFIASFGLLLCCSLTWQISLDSKRLEGKLTEQDWPAVPHSPISLFHTTSQPQILSHILCAFLLQHS